MYRFLFNIKVGIFVCQSKSHNGLEEGQDNVCWASQSSNTFNKLQKHFLMIVG